MTPDLAGTIALPPRRQARWRAALSGVGPGLLGIVGALLLARSLSWTIAAHGLGAWTSPVWGEMANALAQMALSWLPLLLAIIVTGNLGPAQGRRRWLALAVAVVVGALVGLLLRVGLWSVTVATFTPERAADMVLAVWPRNVLLGGLFTLALEAYRREIAHRHAARQAELDQAALESEETAARLQVLQAQVEPHFLFNTLANVRRLYGTEPAAGRVMLEHLMHYLEVALPRLRDSHTTLGREAALVDAYLQIHHMRMGRRLSHDIVVPPALAAHPLPPLMLLTLVENAVKHGLNPSPRGGAIRVEAAAEGDRLRLTVADTGVGFAPGAGTGTGLANLRARLAAQFGDAAALALQNNELGGATATLVLPLDAAAVRP